MFYYLFRVNNKTGLYRILLYNYYKIYKSFIIKPYTMENSEISYLKTDDNKILNEKCIRWVKKIDQCLEVCNKYDGCAIGVSTHKICKLNNPDSYNKLNKHFEE